MTYCIDRNDLKPKKNYKAVLAEFDFKYVKKKIWTIFNSLFLSAEERVWKTVPNP